MKEIVIFLIAILLTACSTSPQQTDNQQTEFNSQQTEVQVQKTEMNIVDALKVGESVKCVVEQEGQTVTIQMKNSMMRMDTLPADVHAIYTSDVYYAWSGKQGAKMKMSDMKTILPESKTPEEVVTERPDVRCVPFAVSSDLFIPPAGVEFQDMSEILKMMK